MRIMGAKIVYNADNNTFCYTTLGNVKHSSCLRGVSQPVRSMDNRIMFVYGISKGDFKAADNGK